MPEEDDITVILDTAEFHVGIPKAQLITAVDLASALYTIKDKKINKYILVDLTVNFSISFSPNLQHQPLQIAAFGVEEADRVIGALRELVEDADGAIGFEAGGTMVCWKSSRSTTWEQEKVKSNPPGRT